MLRHRFFHASRVPGRCHSPTDPSWLFTIVLLLASLLIVHAGLTFLLHSSWYLEAASTSKGLVRCFPWIHQRIESPTALRDAPPFPLSRILQVLTIGFDEKYSPSLTDDIRRGLAGSPVKFATDARLMEKTSLDSCFAFGGERGNVVAELATSTANFAGVVFDSSELPPLDDPTCAPREIYLWGLHNGSISAESIQRHIISFGAGVAVRPGPGGKSYVLISKSHTNPIGRSGMIVRTPSAIRGAWFEAFVIQIRSNWGGNYTCLPPIRFYEYIVNGTE